jgi:hypothetical protein
MTPFFITVGSAILIFLVNLVALGLFPNTAARPGIDITEGARIGVGHGVLAHNLVKISALAA